MVSTHEECNDEKIALQSNHVCVVRYKHHKGWFGVQNQVNNKIFQISLVSGSEEYGLIRGHSIRNLTPKKNRETKSFNCQIGFRSIPLTSAGHGYTEGDVIAIVKVNNKREFTSPVIC